ncbi:MAG TPA: DinB family protein [Vicinamibacterales bacterium]
MATEAWLSGPVEGVDPFLMPVAHSLAQVRQDAERLLPDLEQMDLWQHPGAAASPGFHLMHLAGSLDRLFTYARGETLSDAQKTALASEKPKPAGGGADSDTARQLVQQLSAQIDRCLDQLRRTPRASLTDPREVGRAKLPSSVLGLLFHAAEHATRHAGQLSTTIKALKEE